MDESNLEEREDDLHLNLIENIVDGVLTVLIAPISVLLLVATIELFSALVSTSPVASSLIQDGGPVSNVVSGGGVSPEPDVEDPILTPIPQEESESPLQCILIAIVTILISVYLIEKLFRVLKKIIRRYKKKKKRKWWQKLFWFIAYIFVLFLIVLLIVVIVISIAIMIYCLFFAS